MTDTEAKAQQLEMNCANDMGITSRAIRRDTFSTHEALCRAIERLEATEARHAAELRKLRERFSEALVAIRRKTVPQRCHDAFDELAAPFILPKPDPLVEAIKEATPKTSEAAINQVADNIRAAIEKRGGRIVWGDDQ